MEPTPTPAVRTLTVQIYDYVRMRIEGGELQPGDPIPTLGELAKKFNCTMNPAREAVSRLKADGLVTGGRGRPATVRIPHPRIIRDSHRHQVEKNMARLSEAERRRIGAAEIDHGQMIGDVDFVANYSRTTAPGLGEIFNLGSQTEYLRREFKMVDHRKILLAWSVSHIPISYIEANEALLTSESEPWPGGTMHQLSTVGIEIDQVVDEVTARMPTAAEAAAWALDRGVPLLQVRRTSIDVDGRTVEVSDADYPADRTECRFTTTLTRWENTWDSSR